MSTDEYTRLRAEYVRRQNAACTIYGTAATPEGVDDEVCEYLIEVYGIRRPTAEQREEALVAFLAYLDT